MTPVGKIPVIIQLKDRQYYNKDDIHIYRELSCSEKAAKELGILPPHYLHPQASKTSIDGGAQPEI